MTEMDDFFSIPLSLEPQNMSADVCLYVHMYVWLHLLKFKDVFSIVFTFNFSDM